MSPCTTASPVDCTWRAKRNKHHMIGDEVNKEISVFWCECQMDSSQQLSLQWVCFFIWCFDEMWFVGLYLFSCASHVDNVLNAVVKEVPGVLEVWRWILKHHQLCGVVDTSQRSPFSVPVHLERKEWGYKKCNFALQKKVWQFILNVPHINAQTTSSLTMNDA